MYRGLELAGAKDDGEKKTWPYIRSTGQEVGSIHDLPKAVDPIDRLRGECLAANVAQQARSVNRAA